MSPTLSSGRRRTWRVATLAIGAAVATTVSLTAPATAAQDPADGLTVVGGSALSTDPADYTAGTYIVQFAGEPAASYEGDVAGFAATKPAKGTKIDADSAAVSRYRDRLVQQQQAALAKVGAKAVDNHSLVLNGVTTRLSAQQAAKLAGVKGVVSVNKTQLLKPQTDQSPQFLKMPQLWKDAGGRAGAGKGVVVGVVDSGIWYESKSFKGTGAKAPKGWAGECDLGADGSGEPCNGKIIGARYYVDGFGEGNIADEEFLSPRDGDGHGSHTASTAAGNIVRNVSVDGTDFGTLSGMAPGAQIAAYKVCWTGNVPDTTDDDGCSNADSVSAIEDAVADGVDVINYSIGSTTESSVVDDVEIAFLNAAAAGVFVAASAGNSGPDESTLDHPSPWLTTVAASTHKINEKKLVLGNGAEYIGASSTNELPAQTPMVLASASGKAGTAVNDAKLCFLGALDPAKVAGKLVVCERGVNARAEKSQEVRDAGGAGMVLINPTPNSLNGDLHYVPSIHLPDTAYAPVTAYAATAGATGAIVALDADDVSGTQVPVVADFSSRGPSTTTGGNILKPDIAAPGVDVLAAVTPAQHGGRNYDLLSGTSMASPHIAGIGAVLKQINPKWSPMEIKSAMMTTAGDTIGTTSPFDQGAGQVQPNKASAPGVVFDHGFEDWVGYLIDEGALDPAQFPGIEPVAGTDLNQASVANGSVAGSFTTTRTMTATARNQSLRFSATVPGWRVTTDTPLVSLKKVGDTKTVTLTFTKLSATPAGEWGTGSITWTGADRTKVRIPVALKATTIALSNADVDGTGKPSGSTTVTALPGFTGTLSTQVAGMAGTVPVTDASLVPNQSGFNPTAPAENPSVKKYTMTTNATTAVRFSVATESAGADYDLYLYIAGQYANGPIAVSGSAGGNEELTLTVSGGAATGLPLEIFVHHWGGAAGDSYTYRGYNVGSTAVGNLTVTPPSRQVTQGTPVDFTLAWNSLAAEQSYFGWVNFAAPNGEGELAFVEVR
ncbi:hypothetical protein GCM10028777_01960 [Angustibacter speluncae]